MMYCPKCRGEYRDDAVFCPDCEVDLVPEIPPEIPEEYVDEPWVELHSFSGTLYAQMAIEMLNREGVPAFSKSLFAGSSLGVFGGADLVGDSTAVWVLEPDLERAQVIIEAMISESADELDDDDRE